MKIGFVTHKYNLIGGIEKCVSELVNNYYENHEIHIFSSEFIQSNHKNIFFHKVPVIKKPWILFILSYFIFSYFVINKIKKKHKLNIIHIHSPSLYKGNVVTAHSVHKSGLIEFYKQCGLFYKIYFKLKTLEPLLIFMSKYNFKYCKRVIAVSKSVKKDLIKVSGINPDKIEVIYNGLNVGNFNLKKDNKFYNNKFKILFVANEYKRKGLDLLIKSIGKIKYNDNIILLVVGNNKDKTLTKSDCLNIAQKNKINIKFIPATNKIEYYFINSDIFVLPTLYEPFGMVVSEAMAAGLPVIVSKQAGVSELIKNKYNGLILKNPKNTTEISNKIIELIENKNMYNEIASNSKKIINLLDWNKISTSTLELYRKVI